MRNWHPWRARRDVPPDRRHDPAAGAHKNGLGLMIGLAGAFYLSRFMRALLFGVEPSDPASFGAVSGVLLAVAVLASWLPARRAAKVDPMVALRAE